MIINCHNLLNLSKLRRELGLKELKAPSLTDLHSKSTSNSTQIQVNYPFKASFQ